MNNEKYQQIIDEVWKCFSNVRKSMLMLKPPASENKLREYIEWYEQITTKEEFINKCKTDPEFSEKWELKIEERELSLEERHKLALPIWKEKYGSLVDMMIPTNVDNTPYKIPTKLITITYNDIKTEIYE